MKTTKTITYFDSPGPENTQDCAMLAVERATDLGLHTIVAASSGGATARAFAKAVADTDIRLVIVTHAVLLLAECIFLAGLMRKLFMLIIYRSVKQRLLDRKSVV